MKHWSRSVRELFLRRRGVALACLGAVAVATSIVIAVAWPGRVRLQNRQAQAECRIQLRALYALEMAHFRRFGTYSLNMSELGFRAPADGRYVYLTQSPELESSLGGFALTLPTNSPVPTLEAVASSLRAAATRPGLIGSCPNCSWSAVCVGQLDADPDLDLWSISTQERALPKGRQVDAGEPAHHLDDLQQP